MLIPVRDLRFCEVSHCSNTGAYSVLVTVAAVDYLIDISQHDLQIMADTKANKPSAKARFQIHHSLLP